MAFKAHIQVPIYDTLEKVESYWNSLKPQSAPAASYQEKWLGLAPFFDTVSLQSRVCVTLWDSLTNRFIYAVDKTKVLGENSLRFMDEDGIDYTMSRFHPDYLEATLVMMQKAINYCFEHREFLPFKIIVNEDIVYKKNGGYIHILQQVSVVETDLNKAPLLYLSYIYDITHLKKEPSANMIIKTPAETVMWNYRLAEKKLEFTKSLTPQEKKVLDLLSKGNHSKEISDGLFISPHTVDTHRRNLLAKTNCVDTTALITYARMVGLL